MRTLKFKLSNRLTLKSYAIVLFLLAIFLILIPYVFEKSTINITFYIYWGIIFYFFVVIGITVWIGKILRKIFNLPAFSFLEIILSLLIYLISFPILVFLGIWVILMMFLIPKIKYQVIYYFALIAVFLLGVRIKFFNSFPKEKGPYIVIINHNSFIDYLLVILIMGNKNKYNVVAGANLYHIPIIGFLIKKYAISVNRKDFNSRKKTYLSMIHELESGKNVAIFPEGGRRSFTEVQQGILLKKFKESSFRASCLLGVKILPVILTGTNIYAQKDKKGWWYVSPTKIEIKYLEIIDPQNKTADQILKEAFSLMLCNLS